MSEKSNTLDCMHDQQAVLTNGKHQRKYIVRRLTPLECCRLQGYPDGWTENLAVPDPTIEEVEFFTKVWADWAEINGTKPKSLNQVIKWLADPQSDSAEYKAYGNSLAIPCSYDVLRRIAQDDPSSQAQSPAGRNNNGSTGCEGTACGSTEHP
jgi:DNA (cytosine-5)-methyltransferase 1